MRVGRRGEGNHVFLFFSADRRLTYSSAGDCVRSLICRLSTGSPVAILQGYQPLGLSGG